MFSPGCALMLYKPELADVVHKQLKKFYNELEIYTACCHHEPKLKEKTNIINICPGCDKRFGNQYKLTETISLWEILADSKDFVFPNYKGKEMTIIDACPTRQNEKVHDAIRTLIKKMNIKLIEPEKTRTKSTCCGDSFYGKLPIDQIEKLMMKKAEGMPVEDVIVYCVSCTKSMFIGGKTPHYLVDLLFNQQTEAQTTDPDEWHKQLDEYIEEHK